MFLHEIKYCPQQGYEYDQFGNMTRGYGWGGWYSSTADNRPTYANNRIQRNPVNNLLMQYDAAGNLTFDGVQTYKYDATGQQVSASTTTATILTQSYDGDGLRAQKTESGKNTYYLRSSVLGGQVIAEVSKDTGTVQWKRGYVYLGGQMLAMQDGAVVWVHSEPVTKGQRLTDTAGQVVSTIEVDPFGGETLRMVNSSRQPRKYTTYERDANGGDEAMHRKYEGKWQRFAQPDPFDGSYNLTDPQSFNRYAYVQNDPVSFADPSGLEMCGAEYGYNECGGGGGFWGGSDFGGHVAFYNSEYGGLPPNIVEGMRTHNERVANAQGGNGYRTYAEIIRDLNFNIYYGYDEGGNLWTNFNLFIDTGDLSLYGRQFSRDMNRYVPALKQLLEIGWTIDSLLISGLTTVGEVGPVVVSQWGTDALKAGWVTKGGTTVWNYLKTGKWERTPWNKVAPFMSGKSAVVNGSLLKLPKFWELFKVPFGHRIYTGPIIP
jgi:RHS repeat-associated protein